MLLSLSAACHPLGVTSQLPAGQTCSVGVGLLPAAHQYPMYLQLAGNLSCPLGGTHINCAAVKMSKKIKIFFVVAGKPTAHLALLSILEGLCGWMDGGFLFLLLFLLFTFPFSFPYVTSQALAKSWENLIQDLKVTALYPYFVF